MGIQKSPHTQSEQNITFEQTDLEPDLEQRLAAGDESQLPANLEGEQIGGSRSPRRTPRTGPEHKTVPPAAAYEGSVTTRTPSNPNKQGISSQSSAEENKRQKKVVNAREDAKAGLNHRGKKPAA
jgi:hypothetical protein